MSAADVPVTRRYRVREDGKNNLWAEIPTEWTEWFLSVGAAFSATMATVLWASIDKTGSNITDLTTYNHNDLQNLNAADYQHLTAANHTDLTDGGESALHYHLADRIHARNHALYRV